MIILGDPVVSCRDCPVCRGAITPVFHHVSNEFPFGVA